MKKFKTHITLLLLWLACMPLAHAAEPLSDEALGEITAGTAAAVYDDGRLYIDLSKTTARGNRIGARGDLNFNGGNTTVNSGLLSLSDNAQGNLRALVNTNAVNSAVQVLINLNISINSRIDVLNQINSALQQK
jgi:hypothetical protein